MRVSFVETTMKLAMRWMPLLVFVVTGLLIGACLGYVVWSPGASNYGVVSASQEATRTVRVEAISVTFPSVSISKVGNDASVTIGLTNLRSYPVYVVVSLALASNSGIDTSTISNLTRSSYAVTLAAYGTASHIINFRPLSTGYAFFDLMVKGELSGNIALYVVPS